MDSVDSRPPGTALFHFVRVNRNAYLLPTGLPNWKAPKKPGIKKDAWYEDGISGLHGLSSFTLRKLRRKSVQVRELEAIEGWCWETER